MLSVTHEAAWVRCQVAQDASPISMLRASNVSLSLYCPTPAITALQYLVNVLRTHEQGERQSSPRLYGWKCCDFRKCYLKKVTALRFSRNFSMSVSTSGEVLLPGIDLHLDITISERNRLSLISTRMVLPHSFGCQIFVRVGVHEEQISITTHFLLGRRELIGQLP